jgi:hypothetical protein
MRAPGPGVSDALSMWAPKYFTDSSVTTGRGSPAADNTRRASSSNPTASGPATSTTASVGDPSATSATATAWRIEGPVVVLNVVGKFVGHGGHPEAVEFTVKIQAFGGAGVGRWTLEIGPFLFCVEVVTSGQIRIRYA